MKPATYMNNPYPTETDKSTVLSGTNPPRPATANGAASMVFPEVGAVFQAFWEREESDFNQAPSIELLDLLDEFWALTLGPLGSPKSPTVYVASESQFRRFNPTKGIYEPTSEASVISQLLGNLELVAEFLPPRVQGRSFLNLKNRQRLKSVVERAKDLLVVDSDFFQDRQPHHLVLANGVLRLDNNLQFRPSAPCYPVTETLPVKYDPEAKCDLFLNAFLAHILDRNDIDLLQRYLSQILEGINHSQTILILTGDAGWGKNSLMNILGNLIGWQNVGIIREQLFKDECELAHYCNKHFLYHPDLPTEFLDRPEASIFKQLVGGDPLWANLKNGEGRKVVQGQFPTVLACNGKPRIHIDQDTDAWLRRLVVLSFKTPSHKQHFGKMGEMILKTESSGILNWLLEGRAKLAKDKLQLTQTQEQKERAATLLMESESPLVFVRCCVQRQKGGVIWGAELYEQYQKWCRKLALRPVRGKEFMQMAKAQIETTFGLRPRHDLIGQEGKAKRGWSGLAVMDGKAGETIENQSALSE